MSSELTELIVNEHYSFCLKVISYSKIPFALMYNIEVIILTTVAKSIAMAGAIADDEIEHAGLPPQYLGIMSDLRMESATAKQTINITAPTRLIITDAWLSE
ncbi:MAG: hypothetical protein J1F36_04025 [Clostridiales bacterium]|nr:hypothetical protein [Clostridiales bacterium]